MSSTGHTGTGALALALANERHPLSLMGFAPLAGIVTVLAAIPALGADDGPVMCLSRQHTDVACPSCGMTRGVASLVRGDLAASWAMHPMAIILVIQALIAGLVLGFDVGNARSTWFKWIPAVGVANVIALIMVWILRYNLGTLPVN